MLQIKTVLDSENKTFSSVNIIFNMNKCVKLTLISNDGRVVTDNSWKLTQIEIPCICTVDKLFIKCYIMIETKYGRGPQKKTTNYAIRVQEGNPEELAF